MTEEDLPRVRIVSAPETVPVYNCIVYLQKRGAQVHARVANLQDLECNANSEREALQQIVAEFKRILKECHAENASLPIVDPPPPEKDVTVRYVPVHL